jgi:hypothetical protein
MVWQKLKTYRYVCEGSTGRGATGPSAGQQGLGSRFIEGEFGARLVSQFILDDL